MLTQSAPYMHDGSLGTIEQVIEHYAARGVDNSNLSPMLERVRLTSDDKTALAAFLRALSADGADRAPKLSAVRGASTASR
jgi:cytochrome c peroxidase